MAPPPPPRSDVTVYYDPASAASFRVFTALNEKQVSYEAKPVDPAHDEQLQAWFLELSDSARLPVLRHKDRHVVGDVSTIIEHIDENFGRSGQIYPRGKSGEEARELTRKIEAVPIDLLHEGVACFWPEGVTTKLASPLASKESRVRRRDSLIRLPAMLRRHRLEEESRAAEQNLELLRDRDRVVGLLELVESALDNAEGVLGADDRVGVWLCGPTYTAADAAFAALLLKLDMLGLDSLWKGAERPNIAVYQVSTICINPVIEHMHIHRLPFLPGNGLPSPQLPEGDRLEGAFRQDGVDLGDARCSRRTRGGQQERDERGMQRQRERGNRRRRRRRRRVGRGQGRVGGRAGHRRDLRGQKTHPKEVN